MSHSSTSGCAGNPIFFKPQGLVEMERKSSESSRARTCKVGPIVRERMGTALDSREECPFKPLSYAGCGDIKVPGSD